MILYVAILGVGFGVVTLFLGIYLGVSSERNAWLAHCSKSSTKEPRTVSGQRYYVIADNEYCANCQVRKVLYEEGTSATLEYRQPLQTIPSDNEHHSRSA